MKYSKKKQVTLILLGYVLLNLKTIILFYYNILEKITSIDPYIITDRDIVYAVF